MAMTMITVFNTNASSPRPATVRRIDVVRTSTSVVPNVVETLSEKYR